jgi:uncharacterized protein (DUF2252 family)
VFDDLLGHQTPKSLFSPYIAIKQQNHFTILNKFTHSHSKGVIMSEESLPALAKALIPVQTHTLRIEERLAKGKALREVAARKDQAGWKPPDKRLDPIDLLIESSKGRVEHLLPIRYGRMMVSPFTFYRGAAAIMASDLSHMSSTGLNLVACGDCHLLNFGGFATTERKLIFDLNDFDEVSIAPWEWDLKRLVASFYIAGQANNFDEADCKEAAWLAAQNYRQRMAEYVEMPTLQVWNDSLDLETIIENMPDKESKRFYTKKLASAHAQSDHEKEFAKLTFTAGDTPRIVDHPPLIFHYSDERDKELLQIAKEALNGYKRSLNVGVRLLLNRFAVVDVAFKVVGVGSVGTVCGIILLMSGKGDALFLQFKQARQSVLEPYCGASPYKHAGQRVVLGQRAVQAAGDMFLGWTTGTGKLKTHLYLRQLSDAKIKPVIEIMNQANLKNYAGLCGKALARAHARSGDPAVLTGYMGKSTAFEDAFADFGAAYADQNERDHAALLKAIRSGRLEARTTE